MEDAIEMQHGPDETRQTKQTAFVKRGNLPVGGLGSRTRPCWTDERCALLVNVIHVCGHGEVKRDLAPRVLEGQTNGNEDTLTKFMTAMRHESRRSSRPLALKPSPATRVQSYINSCQEHSTQSGGLRSSCRGPSRTLGGGCRPTKISAALGLHDTSHSIHCRCPTRGCKTGLGRDANSCRSPTLCTTNS